MTEKLNPFFKLLKAEIPNNINSKLKKNFDSVNKTLSGACELALKKTHSWKAACLDDGRKL